MKYASRIEPSRNLTDYGKACERFIWRQVKLDSATDYLPSRVPRAAAKTITHRRKL